MLNFSLAVYRSNYPKQKLTKSDDIIVCNPVKQATMGVHKKIQQTKSLNTPDEFLKIYLFDKVVNIVYFM